LLVGNNKMYFITSTKNQNNMLKEKKIRYDQIVHPKNFENLIVKIIGKKIVIDIKSCSYFYENILSKKFTLLKKFKYFKINLVILPSTLVS